MGEGIGTGAEAGMEGVTEGSSRTLLAGGPSVVDSTRNRPLPRGNTEGSHSVQVSGRTEGYCERILCVLM